MGSWRVLHRELFSWKAVTPASLGGHVLIYFWEHSCPLLATPRSMEKDTCGNGRCVLWLVLSSIYLSILLPFLASLCPHIYPFIHHPSPHPSTHHPPTPPPFHPFIYLADTQYVPGNWLGAVGDMGISRIRFLPSENIHQWDSIADPAVSALAQAWTVSLLWAKLDLFVCSFIYSTHRFYVVFFSCVSSCVSIAVLRPLPSCGAQASHRGGCSCCEALACEGSVAVVHGRSRPMACGVFPDQGSNLCPLPWQADSYLLDHQGGPQIVFICLQGRRGKKNSFLILNIVIPKHLLST